MADLNNLKKGQTITEHIDTINTNVNLVNGELIGFKDNIKNVVEENSLVKSVQWKTGNVILTASEIGAFPNSTSIQELDINNIKDTGVYIGTNANNPYYLIVIKYNDTNIYQELIGLNTKRFRRFTGSWSEWITAYSNENPVTASDITGIHQISDNKYVEVALLNDGTFVKANITINPSTNELKLGDRIVATTEYVDKAVNMIKSVIVNELPETAVENTIYFVPNTKEDDANEFVEWIWVNGAWEIVGGTSIDLTPFLTKADASEIYATKQENDDKVPKTTTINNKALTGNITLNAEDVGALPIGTKLETNAVNKYTNEEIETKLSNGEFVNGNTFIVLDDGDCLKGHTYTYNNGLIDITDMITDYVNLDGNQSIGGVKNFTGLLKYLGEEVATEKYVDENGGKIDVIAVNGENQTIDGKRVNIAVPTTLDELATDEEKAVLSSGITLKRVQDISTNKEDIIFLKKGKVDNVTGKGLSTNDFTDDYKDKLDELEPYDDTDIKASITNLTNNKADKSMLENYTLSVDEASKISLDIDTSTYTITMKLLNSKDEELSSDNVDLPLETMVVDAKYNSTTKEIVLTLKNGNTTKFSVADLVSGLASQSALNTTNTNLTNLTNSLGDLAFVDSLSKGDVGLGNVDNTSDANKPISTATQTALNKKANISDLGDLAYLDSLTASDVGALPSDTEIPSIEGLAKQSDVDGLTTRVGNLESGKVDKINGKGLSTNDYTTAEKNKLAGLSNYDDSVITEDINNLENNKVDKVTGKALSTNDFTNAYKNKLDGLSNYDDTQVKSDISSLSTNKADKSSVTAIDGRVTTIEGKIPTLATQDFVNSSIATATATFKGTYDEFADLKSVSADENDYAFVETTDSIGNKLYKRYKYVDGAWVFEYDLNNSSFTAQQWATINSGVTASDRTSFVNNITEVGNIKTTLATKADKSEILPINDATILVRVNGAAVGSFTTNQSTDEAIDISVPTGTAASKGYTTSITGSSNLPTDSAVKSFVEGKGYITKDASITGNAATATKATQDGSGNNIVNTYATKSALTSVENKIPTNNNQLTNGAGYVTSSGSVASATKATQDGNGKNIADTYATNVKVNGLIDRLDATGVKQITDTTILLAGLTTGIHKLANSAIVSTGNKSITCEAGTIIIAQRTDATAVNGIIYRPAYEHRFLAWINSSYGDDYLELSYVADLKRGYIDGNPIATYPIGTYLWTDGSYNPAEKFGGTWEQIKDVFLLASGNTYAVGSTGGEATHTLTESEMPRHRHQQTHADSPMVSWSKLYSDGNGSYGWSIKGEAYQDSQFRQFTMFMGNSQPHNNMPPYKVGCLWLRIA